HLRLDGVSGGDPVNGALDGAATAVATDRGGIVGAAHLRHLTVATHREVGALDDVGGTQTNLGAGRQPEILLWGAVAEVVALDPQLAAERDLSRAGGGVFGIVDGIQLLDLALGVVGNDELEGAEDGHAPLGAAVEILADAMLEQRQLHRVVGLGDTDALPAVTDALRRVTPAGPPGP